VNALRRGRPPGSAPSDAGALVVGRLADSLLAGPPAPVSVEAPHLRVPAGGTAEARVVVRIRPGFHVQANPAAEEFLVPLTVDLSERPPVRVGPLSGCLRYQACNDRVCLRPSTAPLRLIVRVRGSTSGVRADSRARHGVASAVPARSTSSRVVPARGEPHASERLLVPGRGLLTRSSARRRPWHRPGGRPGARADEARPD